MKRDSDQILTEWLVIQAQGGSAKALQLLCSRWYPVLYRFALARLGNADVARDVVQDTFVAIHRGFGRLRDPSAFPKWAYQILCRRSADHFRRKDGGGGTDEDDYPPLAGLDEQLVPALDIHQALRSLDQKCYEVVHLHYLHGFGIKEIAAITAVPPGTVKSRLHAARKRLRTLLGGEAYE